MFILAWIIFASTYVQKKSLPVLEKMIREKYEEKFAESNIYAAELVMQIEEAREDIRHKALQISAMLQNLPLGICTINKDRDINDDYSKTLETIFNLKNLKGADYTQLLCQDTDLDTSAVQVINDTILCCMHESNITFLANVHLLPKFIKKNDGHKKQLLELEWIPIFDEEQHVERLMIIIKDISNFEMLKKNSESKEEKIQIILQLIDLPHDKIFAYFNSVKTFAKDIHMELESHEADMEHILRNTHTIKGNSKSCRFKKIVDYTHAFEEFLHETKKKNMNLDLFMAKKLLKKIVDTTALYQHIFKTQVLKTEHNFISKIHSIEDIIDKINDQSLQNPNEISKLLKKSLSTGVDTEIRKTIQNCFKDLKNTCRDLGKDLPILILRGDDFIIPSNAAQLLTHSLNHLFINAMDHGLETPEERSQFNKSSQGKITLTCIKSNSSLTIYMTDDGRGLNLAKIKEKATSLGLIEEDASDLDIANSIFLSGVSTAERLTQTSGMGVGLDAVKKLYKNCGDIEIELLGPVNNQNTQAFQFKIQLQLEKI